MSKVRGNALVAQSGGPTAVINASACGVIQQALKSEEITGVYGAYNGILGVLQEDIFDIGAESAETIEMMKTTPSAAIGSCRYKLRKIEEDRADFERVLEVFEAHGIRYFFYTGQLMDHEQDYLPGDAVFFDWTGDGEIDHVALVSEVVNGRPVRMVDATGVIEKNPTGLTAELDWLAFHESTVRGHARWDGSYEPVRSGFLSLRGL